MTFPGAGNDVGSAYIRILADGSNLDESIRKEFRDHNKEFERQGHEGSAAYNKGFDDELKKRPLWAKAVASLREGSGRQDAAVTFFGSETARNIRKGLEQEFTRKGSGGKVIADRIWRDITQGSIDDFTKGLGRIDSLARKAAQDISRQQQQNEVARQRLADRADKDVERRLSKLSSLLETHNKKDVDNTIAAFRARANEAINLVRRGGGGGDLDTLTRDLDRFGSHASKDLVKVQGYFRTSLRELTPLEIKMKKLNDDFDKASQLAGKAFGKGSRNNFFNALGAGVEGLTKVAISGIPRVLGFLGELKSEFSIAGQSGEGFAGKISAVMDTVFNNVNQVGNLIIGGISGAVGGIGLFVSVAGPLAAAISAVTAAAVALAGTLAFALAGAIGTVAPLILPLIASVGVLGLAFSNMSKSAKKSLSADFKPIVKSFQDLRESIQDNLFKRVGEDVKLLGPTLARAKPIISGVADAISQVFDVFVRKLRGPGFVAFLATMRKFLPDAVIRLGDIFGNIFTGISGVFRALAPFATKFLQTLQKLTDRFDNWANSAKGQNRITRFMQDAGKAAAAVYQVITSLLTATGKLLSAGNKPGQGFLKSISDSLDRFSAFLSSPAGQKGLQTFFSRAKEAFGGLGVLLDGVGKLFGALNSQAGQTILVGVFKALGTALSVFSKLLPPVTALLQGLGKAALGVLGFFKPLFDFFSNHTGVLKAIGVALGVIYLNLKLMALLRFAENGLSGFFTVLSRGAIGVGANSAGVGLGQIARNMDSMSRAMRGVNAAAAGVVAGGIAGQVSGGGVGGWLTSILGGGALGAGLGAAGGPIGLAVGAIAGGLSGAISHATKLWSDHGKAAKAAADAAKTAADQERQHIQELTDALLANNGAIDAGTKLNIAKGLQNSGQFDKTKTIQGLSPFAAGLTPKLLTDAASGNGAALAQFDKILTTVEAHNPLLIQQVEALRTAITGSSDSIRTATENTIQLLETQTKNYFATKSVKEQVQELTASYGADAKSLDTNTAAGLLNQQFIIDHVASLKEAAAAAVSHGEKIGAANVKLNQQVGAFRAQLIAAGFSKTAVDQLITSLGLLKPKDVPINVKTKEAKVTADSFFASLPTAARIKLQLDTAAGVFDLHAFLNQIPHSVDIQAHLRGQNTALVSAAGRLTNGPTLSWIGEAGPEAVVPLRRPLSQVDASVRWLSAIAQGKALPNGTVNKMASGGIVGGGKTVNFGPGAIQVVTPTTDPRAVANELLNEMVAKGY